MKQDSQTLSMWAAVLNRYEKSTVIPIVFILTKTELNCSLSGSKPVLKKKHSISDMRLYQCYNNLLILWSITVLFLRVGRLT